MFSYPAYLDRSVVSELEDQIIDICNSCPALDDLISSSAPVWEWACRILKMSASELRHRIETHETDEQFPSAYLEEKDHLLKLPLILLEKINS